MSFETKKFNVVKKKNLEKSTFNVECNIETNCEISKILSVCHTAQADSVEILNGCVNYTGYIDFCVLYLTPDGEIGTLNSSCPFTSKFEDALISVGDKIKIKVSVEDYVIESFSSSNLKINCVCEQTGILIISREIPNVDCHDEEICCKEDEILVNVFVGEAKESFSVESDFSIKEPLKKVVSSDSQVFVKSVESGENFVSISGEVVNKILYLTENDRFENSYVVENFKQEVELEGVTKTSICEVNACVKKNSLKCEIENNDKGVEIKVVSPVDICVFAYMEKSEKVLKDVYSTVSELSVTTTSFDMSQQLACEILEEKIDGTLTLEDDKPRVDKIMFVGGSNVCVTNSYVKDGEVFVEGVCKSDVVYLNDESGSLFSVIMEVPFVISDKTNFEEEDKFDVEIELCDVDVVVKKGREFYFDAKLKANICCFQDVVGAVISNVEESGETAERDCAIEVLFAQAGQDAWEIGKLAKVKEENIIYQNPDVNFPLEKDENIVIFYKKY